MKYSLLIVLFLMIGCQKAHRETVMGEWSGNSITITSRHGEESANIPIEKYGYLTLSMNRDSSYTLALAVLKDVRVEQKMFGLEVSEVLIPAVYKSTRFGKWSRDDSVFALSSSEGSIFVKFLAEEQELNLNFTDREGRKWLCKLEPKE
jgi:hypothetical protein